LTGIFTLTTVSSSLPYWFGFSFIAVFLDLDYTIFLSHRLPSAIALPLRYLITLSVISESIRLIVTIFLTGVFIQSLRLFCVEMIYNRSLRVCLLRRHYTIYRQMLISLNYFNSSFGNLLCTVLSVGFVLIICFGYCSLATNTELPTLICIMLPIATASVSAVILWVLHIEMTCFERSTECLTKLKLSTSRLGTSRRFWTRKLKELTPLRFYPCFGDMELFYIKKSTLMTYFQMAISHIASIVLGLRIRNGLNNFVH
jgi:hypothetical protein